MVAKGVHGFDFGRPKREKRAVVSGATLKSRNQTTNADEPALLAA